MRRNVRNEKVIRAIAIGLATMMTTTSVPVNVFADEIDGDGNSDPVVAAEPQVVSQPENNGGQSSSGENNKSESSVSSTPVEPASPNPAQTVEAAANEAAGMASAVEATVGSLRVTDGEGGVKEATGDIGKLTQSALDEISLLQEAQDAQANLYKTAVSVGEAGILDADADHGRYGEGQVGNSEKKEKAAEEAIGVKVKINENGEAVVETKEGLKNTLDAPNQAINNAGKAKETAGEALDGVDQAIKNLNGKNGDITVAQRKKEKADEDIDTALEAIANKTELDTKKLDEIEKELVAAVNEKEIVEAVSAASKASSSAAKTADDKLGVVKEQLQIAKDSASEAQTHSTDYTYQQMESLAVSARNAASTAKTASQIADRAVAAARTKENEANQKVNNAQDALTKAQKDAADILRAYKDQIDEINRLIDTANESASDAEPAMKKANEAIDKVLKMMEDTEDTSVEGVRAKVEAMNEAITQANEAIELSKKAVNDKYGKQEYKAATDRYGWTKQRIDDFQTKIDKLEEAKSDHDKALEAVETASANRDHAAQTVKDIKTLVDDLEEQCTEWAKAVDVDIQDLKALLTTDGQYSYEQLKTRAGEMEVGLNLAGSTLVETYKANKDILAAPGEGDSDLKAEDIAVLYKEALSAKEGLETNVGNLAGQIIDQNNIITDCNSREGDLKSAVDSAHDKVSEDIANMSKKYKFDESTNDFVKDEKGKYVLSDEYLALCAAAEETEGGSSEYKCGDKVLPEKAKVGYTDPQGSRYVRTGEGTVVETGRPDGLNDKVEAGVTGGSPVVSWDEDKQKFVQDIECRYVEDITKTGNLIDKVEADVPVRLYGSKPSDEEAKLEILRSYLAGNKVLTANLNVSEMRVAGNTVTVTLTNSNTDRIPEGFIEDHKLNFTIEPDDTDWIEQNLMGWWEAHCTVTISEVEASLDGRYAAVREYDYEKYDLVVTPGNYTEAAQKTREELFGEGGIDQKAEKAKAALADDILAHTNANTAYDTLKGERQAAFDKLYGKGGSDKEPKADSLVDQMNKAEAAKTRNQNIIDKLGADVSSYNTVAEYKRVADTNLENADEFDINKADYLSEQDRENYKKADNAKTRITNKL